MLVCIGPIKENVQGQYNKALAQADYGTARVTLETIGVFCSSVSKHL